MKSRKSVIRSGRLVRIAAILLLAGLAAACAGPYYEQGPSYGPGPGGRWLTSREIRRSAERAVYQYALERFGPGSRPKVKSLRIQRYDRDEAEVNGRLSVRRGLHPFQRGNGMFRCLVDRRHGRVRGIDFY